MTNNLLIAKQLLAAAQELTVTAAPQETMLEMIHKHLPEGEQKLLKEYVKRIEENLERNLKNQPEKLDEAIGLLQQYGENYLVSIAGRPDHVAMLLRGAVLLAKPDKPASVLFQESMKK